jgi:curved DNA-binding protein CbpA
MTASDDYRRHCKVLGVPEGASDADVKRAYHRQAQRWHPDANPGDPAAAEAMMKEINEAYALLRGKDAGGGDAGADRARAERAWREAEAGRERAERARRDAEERRRAERAAKERAKAERAAEERTKAERAWRARRAAEERANAERAWRARRGAERDRARRAGGRAWATAGAAALASVLAAALAFAASWLGFNLRGDRLAAQKRARAALAEELMDKEVEARGGARTFREIRSLVLRATVKEGEKIWPMTLYRASPNLMLSESEVEIPGTSLKVRLLNGCDGSSVWSYNALTGPEVKGGRAAEEALEGAKMGQHTWRDLYTGAEAVGVETVEGEACHRVELTRWAGGPVTKYLSVETGLLVKEDLEIETEAGRQRESTVFGDYREAGGVLWAFRAVKAAPGRTSTMTRTEIRVNADLPKSTFVPPVEVRRLLGESKRAP